MKNECNENLSKINNKIKENCNEKVNSLKSCDTEEECNCSNSSSSSNSGFVDLVILVDSSGSMTLTWSAINDASEFLEDAIYDKCGAKSRITLLSLDRKNPGTGTSAPAGFQSHEDYISTYGSFSGAFHTDDSTWDGEQGSKAIADVSKYFPWEEEACRSILYISDEWLDSISNGESASASSIPIAVNAAISNNVTLFTHLVDSTGGSQNNPANHPAIANHYTNLAESTGGSAHIGDNPSKELYTSLISDVACNCGDSCKELDIPKFKPCISISWGDSECDCFETDDIEKLCITVCNCYSNISFNNFSIGEIEVTDIDGNSVALLPDGTASVDVIPNSPICYGNIEPCGSGENSCISREFAILTRGAKEGEYKINLKSICFDIAISYKEESCFKFDLCRS